MKKSDYSKPSGLEKHQRMGYIYTYTNKVNGKVYVGKTINWKKRVSQHKSTEKLRKRTPISNAFKKYGYENFDLVVVARCSESLLNQCEMTYIENMKESGVVLYNLTKGGDGSLGLSPSMESRMKLSQSKKRENLSAETRKKLSDSKKGINLSKEHRMKVSEAKKRENLSPETRKKLSDSKKGNKYSLGMKKTPESIEKVLNTKHRNKIKRQLEAHGVIVPW